VKSVIYTQRPCFENILIVVIMSADLCYFWKLSSVIYRQKLFFEKILMVAIRRLFFKQTSVVII
jgi:hypothetical protein